MEIKSNLIFRSDFELKKGRKYGSLVLQIFRQIGIVSKSKWFKYKSKKNKNMKNSEHS